MCTCTCFRHTGTTSVNHPANDVIVIRRQRQYTVSDVIDIKKGTEHQLLRHTRTTSVNNSVNYVIDILKREQNTISLGTLGHRQ